MLEYKIIQKKKMCMDNLPAFLSCKGFTEYSLRRQSARESARECELQAFVVRSGGGSARLPGTSSSSQRSHRGSSTSSSPPAGRQASSSRRTTAAVARRLPFRSHRSHNTHPLARVAVSAPFRVAVVVGGRRVRVFRASRSPCARALDIRRFFCLLCSYPHIRRIVLNH